MLFEQAARLQYLVFIVVEVQRKQRLVSQVGLALPSVLCVEISINAILLPTTGGQA